jgi:FkbM family methyltransferase
MKKKLINILSSNFGKKRMQSLYETLYNISLLGMNYGNVRDFKSSGELHALKYIKDSLNEENALTIFDVGANDGNYSRTLAEFFENKSTIHSFEPSSRTFEVLLKTTSSIANIVPNNFGFGETESSLLLYSDINAPRLASVYKRNLIHFGMSMDRTEEIKITTIENYCNHTKIDHIHFLKLDIEGHELKALHGAKQLLEDGKIDFIQFEFGGCNIDSRTYFQDFYYLLKDKYRIYRILKDGLFEIQNYKESHEIFISINYLAERIN